VPRALAGRVHGRSPMEVCVIMAKPGSPSGKREVIAPSGRGSSRFARRDTGGQFTSDQVKTGRSISRDRKIAAKTKAPKGMKDRGD